MAERLEQLLGRLEVTTARLEAVERTLSKEGSGSTAQQSRSLRAGSAATATATPAAPVAHAAAQSSAAPGEPIQAYRNTVLPAAMSLVDAAQGLDEEVAAVSRIVEQAFQAQGIVLEAVATCQKPDAQQLQKLVMPVASLMQAASALPKDRRSTVVNHCKTAAGALQALSWIVYSGPGRGLSLPALHIEESWQSAEFYANKVLKEHKASSPQHATWVKALRAPFDLLKVCVKKYHVAGPAWNAQGAPLSQFKPGAQPSASTAPSKASAPTALAPPPPAPGAGGGPARAARPGPPAPPPPPPGGPGSLLQKSPAAPTPAGAAAPAAGMSAVFAALNKGEAVTSGLKKVTADMKTKNMANRNSTVPAREAPTPIPQSGPASLARSSSKAKPRTELEQGRKWVVENHTDNRELIITETSPKQTVYIYNCTNCTVQVEGKVNAITVDQCKRTGLLFADVVSSCEVVNSQSIQVQCTNIVPTLAVDKSDGVQMYLPAKALDIVNITTAKSSEVNVAVSGLADDLVEHPIPEQFVSVFKNGKLSTEPVSHVSTNNGWQDRLPAAKPAEASSRLNLYFTKVSGFRPASGRPDWPLCGLSCQLFSGDGFRTRPIEWTAAPDWPKADSESWQFPHLESAEADEKSAAAAVLKLTSLDVEGKFTTDHGEVAIGDTTVRLFIAAGVPEDLPDCSAAGEEWQEVRWLPWQPLLSGGPHPQLGANSRAPERELVRPFLNFVFKWHDRHRQALDKSVIGGAEALELGQAALFRPTTWSGPLPRETLSQWCQQNQVPEACYTILDGQHPKFKCASCIISHRAAVITPEWGYLRAEDAMDNAALAAIIFLEKGLSMTTHRCKITALGETPQLGVLHYVASRSEVASMLRSQDAALKAEKERLQQEMEARLQSLDDRILQVSQQQEALQTQSMDEDAILSADDLAMTATHFQPASSLPVYLDGAGVPHQGKNKKQRTAKAVARAAAADEKNAVQTLKEALDKKKWPQAMIEFVKVDGQAGHTCNLHIPNCGVAESATAANQKLAKSMAAESALNTMRSMGLLP
ncbi:hypothetical protein WJX84_003625 [Apatococcus fuscideae]|uniref:C-CAP/cofactor C-like domain-containing protein n=1 Tax=Apatococcus fuscideae TaxID=2026836 RepID=A0AAW1TIU6_9CHLO